MSLTPILVTAMNGLLRNTTFDLNVNFVNAISAYKSRPLVSAFSAILSSGINQDTINDITTIYINKEYLVNLNKTANACVTPNPIYFTEFLTNWGDIILAKSHTNNHAKFVQTLQSSMGHISTMNDAINSAVNGQAVAAKSFTSSTELTTGNLTAVTTNTQAFSAELTKTGDLLNFSELKFYGTPHGLVLSLIRNNVLGLLKSELVSAGVNYNELITTVVGADIELLPQLQKVIYTVFTQISGTTLQTILDALGVTTQDIHTVADLLDTTKLFPSWHAINAMQLGVLIKLSEYNGPITSLDNIIGREIANRNIGFRNIMYQIKGIESTNVLDIAEQYTIIELNDGLDVINAFKTALPQHVTDEIIDPTMLGGGQNVNNSYFLTDCIGTPCGTVHTGSLLALSEYHDSLDDTIVQSILNRQQYILDWYLTNPEPPQDTVGCIPTNVGDCPWYDWNQDRIAVVTPLILEITTLVDSLPLPEIEATFAPSIVQVATEYDTLTDAIDWPTGLCDGLLTQVSTTSAKKIAIGFANSLHALSSRTDLHDVVEVLEKLSTTTEGGNAIIGSMREGRNLRRLDSIGVISDTQIPPSQNNPAPRV